MYQAVAAKRLADAEPRLRRFQTAIAAGVDPAALVESINQAQAQRAAAHAELDNTPLPQMLTEAEIYAMIDYLGDVDSAPSRSRARRVSAAGPPAAESGVGRAKRWWSRHRRRSGWSGEPGGARLTLGGSGPTYRDRSGDSTQPVATSRPSSKSQISQWSWECFRSSSQTACFMHASCRRHDSQLALHRPFVACFEPFVASWFPAQPRAPDFVGAARENWA